MRLYILRHGDAYDTDGDDSLRELTAKGRQTVGYLGQVLREKEFSRVTEIWHSPLVRAVQSAEVLAEACRLEVPRRARAGMLPEDDPEPIAQELLSREDDVILVGHNPHLTFLGAHLLTGKTNRASIVFKKASLLCLERVGPASAEFPGGHWALGFFLIPRVTGLAVDRLKEVSD